MAFVRRILSELARASAIDLSRAARCSWLAAAQPGELLMSLCAREREPRLTVCSVRDE